MAKTAAKTISVAPGINVALLTAIGSGEVTYISKDDGGPLLAHNPPLIEVNTAADAIVDDKAPVRLSEAGKTVVQAQQAGSQLAASPKPATPGTSTFTIVSGAVMPASKRGGGGGGGAPTKYPFEQMEVGQSFFVSNSQVKGGDAVKKLGSTVSSVNMKYSVETGEMETVERTKRGEKNKAVLDAAGNKVKETITRSKRKSTRKFAIRPATAGTAYGTFTPSEDGAMIFRVL